MSQEQQPMNEKAFLASLGLDDIELEKADNLQPPDGQWLLETLDTLSLLRQIGALANNTAPVLDPPPEGSDDKPPIVAELLDLLKNSQKNQEK
jgi:hypothetical protein